MKKLLVFFLLTAALSADCQKKEPATLRSILLEQFQTTWNKEDWFVPISIAVEGLSAKQAMWKPCDSCHSAGQIAYHLLYWNKEQLNKFNGTKQPPNPNDNNETFTRFTEASWTATVNELNQVMKEWETVIKNTDEAKLQSWYTIIAHISAHNAYHTGQILYVRKLAGNWDPKKGVQ